MLKRTDQVGPPARREKHALRWMARRQGASEWQIAFRDQNAYEAKCRAAVKLRCEPYEVELEPYRADANRQPVGAPALPTRQE